MKFIPVISFVLIVFLDSVRFSDIFTFFETCISQLLSINYKIKKISIQK